MRDLELIEADITTAREHIKKVNDFMKDKPFLNDALQFTLRALGEKIKALESIINEHNKDRIELFKTIHIERSKIDNYHLDNAIKNLQLAKYEGKLSNQKQLVLIELLKQKNG